MAEPTALERRVALAIARLYTDDACAEKRAEALIPHARAAIAEVAEWAAEVLCAAGPADANAAPAAG